MCSFASGLFKFHGRKILFIGINEQLGPNHINSQQRPARQFHNLQFGSLLVCHGPNLASWPGLGCYPASIFIFGLYLVTTQLVTWCYLAQSAVQTSSRRPNSLLMLHKRTLSRMILPGHQSQKRRSIQRFVITEKAPIGAFSQLKVATTTFTFKTLC